MPSSSNRALVVLLGALGTFAGAIFGHAFGAAQPYGDAWRIAHDQYTGPTALFGAVCGAGLGLAAWIAQRREGGFPSKRCLLRCVAWTSALVGFLAAFIATRSFFLGLAFSTVGLVVGLASMPLVLLIAWALGLRRAARDGSLVERARLRNAARIPLLLAAATTLLRPVGGIPSIPPLCSFPTHACIAACALLVVLSLSDVFALRRHRVMNPNAQGWQDAGPSTATPETVLDFGTGDQHWVSTSSTDLGYRQAPERRCVAHGDHQAAAKTIRGATVLGVSAIVLSMLPLVAHFHEHLAACRRTFDPTSIVLSVTKRTYEPVCFAP